MNKTYLKGNLKRKSQTMIKNDVKSIESDATVAHKFVHEEEKTKDYKALYMIHQCVDVDNFEKVGDCESSK